MHNIKNIIIKAKNEIKIIFKYFLSLKFRSFLIFDLPNLNLFF